MRDASYEVQPNDLVNSQKVNFMYNEFTCKNLVNAGPQTRVLPKKSHCEFNEFLGNSVPHGRHLLEFNLLCKVGIVVIGKRSIASNEFEDNNS